MRKFSNKIFKGEKIKKKTFVKATKSKKNVQF